MKTSKSMFILATTLVILSLIISVSISNNKISSEEWKECRLKAIRISCNTEECYSKKIDKVKKCDDSFIIGD